MDFKKTPIKYQPAYTWLWNTNITREGIKERIEEMYSAGIRAFYVLGEPENFRPNLRRTHLSPEYLSDEYINLVYYAYELARKKGMYTWLYNEGGFPSGMACGKIRREHPELAMKVIEKREIFIKKGESFTPCENSICAFADGVKVNSDMAFDRDTAVTEYFSADSELAPIRTDNASLENTRIFIEETHEKLKARFGDAMGSSVTLMFDDEAFMGTWTQDLEKIFFNKYGYDISDFIPYIIGDAEPKKEDEYRAKSDYIMLCGELVRDNYFVPMKKWLNKNGMLSTGHIDNDHRADGIVINRYGNSMKTLRSFDLPGIDAIWNQIYYPDGNNGFTGMSFFPRFASSASRQLGHSDAISESFAVYGAHVDQELMRYAVNYQAVRGISLFNFMVMSYDKKTPMLHQYRPNFVKENPSMDRLSEINEYTARLSYILSVSRADITSAIYFPARSISAGGALGKKAEESFTRLGEELERKGVCFDVIDEDIVLSGNLINGSLVYNSISYENVFVPDFDFEPDEVTKKLSSLKSEILPCIERKNKYIQSRKVIFEDGREGYFIVNTSNGVINETVKIKTKRTPYRLDLSDGEIYEIDYLKNDDSAAIDISLLRGEAVFIIICDKTNNILKQKREKRLILIDDFSSFVSRRQLIDTKLGTVNNYFESGDLRQGLYEWGKDFSGEVTYLANIPALDEGEYILDLGKVCCTAAVYIDDSLVGETTFPPYKVKFTGKNREQKLKIIVANTAANECARTDYFNEMDIRDVGPYHEKMKDLEAKKCPGGLFGPVWIKRVF